MGGESGSWLDDHVLHARSCSFQLLKLVRASRGSASFHNGSH